MCAGKVSTGEIQRSAGVIGRMSRMSDLRGYSLLSCTLIRVVPPSIRSLTGDGICGVPPFCDYRPQEQKI
ncbi:MAG: hypothetical protein K2K19_14700 [Acetatifactor sp.]|nr:hypothetical protein [Acetatifactor sp.]